IDLPYIVIVDNASINPIIPQDLSFYPHVKVINNSKNVGFGKANNIGIKWVIEHVQTLFVFLLNNDTIVTENTLKNLFYNFPASENVVMASPKILTMEEKPRIWYGGGSFNYSRMTPSINNFNEYDVELEDRIVEFTSGCAMF